jgi:hypothetical protein
MAKEKQTGMTKLIDVFMSQRTGTLVTLERPKQVAEYMLKNKRYTGTQGRYAPIEEQGKWFEVVTDDDTPTEKPEPAKTKQVPMTGNLSNTAAGTSKATANLTDANKEKAEAEAAAQTKVDEPAKKPRKRKRTKK